MRIWCVSAPLYSHSDWGGFLKTAQALQARGHEVTWVSGPALGAAVTRAGLRFAAVNETGWLWPPPPAPDLSTLSPAAAVMLRYRRALDTWLSEDIVGTAAAELIALAKDSDTPDVILADPFLSAAALAAEALAVPLLVCGWPAQETFAEDTLFPVQKNLASDSQERITRLLRRFGLAGVNFSKGATPSILSPHLHISYFSPTWYQAEADSILAQTLFVGGAPEAPADMMPEWLNAIPAETPLALITLGTVFTGDLGFFSWAAQAAARVGLLPLVVLSNNPIAPEEKAKLKAALPGGTRLLNWAPFGHVLPRCKLAIHHGGMGTTHAITLHGIPQIVVPHAADQRGQARRVAQAKIGLNLTAHDVRNGALLQGARALLADARIQERARAVAAEMAALGGPQRAAVAVEEKGKR
ncbi:MAG: glycosyltransferase family 1 protein [Chloroflexi bacterium]|nr:glycosyltransferase family 1 protein [Chloroflexota bacterium]